MWLAMELSGRPMVLTVEGNPDDAIISLGGYGNAKRVGHDISPNWGSMTSLVDTGAPLWPFAHNGSNPTFGGWWNDLDMIEVGNAPDFVCGADAGALARCQAHYSQWCIMKAPLILGNDIPNESAATLSVLSNAEAVAVNQDALGVQAQRVNQAALPPALAPASLPFGRGNHAVLARCDAARETQAWELRKDGALATTDAAGRVFCLGSTDGALTEGSWAGVECGSPAATRFSVSRRDRASGSVAITTASGAALAFNNRERAAGPAPFARHVLALEEGDASANASPSSTPARWVLEGGGRVRAAMAKGDAVVEYDASGRLGRAPGGAAHCLDLAAGQLETWCGPLTGGRVAVSLFNRAAAAAPITVSFAACNASATNAVRDIWAAADKGSFTGSYTATVASEATAFLVLTPA
jgi:hypothetical protein